MTIVVTAFVPIPDHPRSEDEYHFLGQRLLELEIPLMSMQGKLEDCWLYKFLRLRNAKFTHSIADNPAKNTIEYHIVQAQKTTWLWEAALCQPGADVFVWLDYGIFHIPGVTGSIIKNFLHRVQNEQAIAIPGCWRTGEFTYSDDQPCWRWCGGTLVVPRMYVAALDIAMKREYVRWLELTNNVSWEVNVLTRVEQMEPQLPLWWYGPCNHDHTMFTMYKQTEHADEQKIAADQLSARAAYL